MKLGEIDTGIFYLGLTIIVVALAVLVLDGCASPPPSSIDPRIPICEAIERCYPGDFAERFADVAACVEWLPCPAPDPELGAACELELEAAACGGDVPACDRACGVAP